MVKQIGLDQEIDKRLDLLKVNVPYHESDHVLNLAYSELGLKATFWGWLDNSAPELKEL